MPRSYTDFYKKRCKYLSEQVERGFVSKSDAEEIREMIDPFDEDKSTTKKPSWPDALSKITGYRDDFALVREVFEQS